MTTFTASEVREEADEAWSRCSLRHSKMLNAFADLLEAQEKAVPVMVVNHVSSAEHDLPIGMKLYAHPVPADAERLAEALRNLVSEWVAIADDGDAMPKDSTIGYRACANRLSAMLAAHSTQAQPPAARVTDTLAVFEVVSGVEGPCLTISRKADGKPRHEYRLAGPKPWGGGNTTHSFKVHTRELREQIDAIETALAAQENPNG